jgi:hypothetical protein
LPTSLPAVLLGAPKPRIEIRPEDIVASDGDLAADLMEAAGKPLEEWQRDGLDLMLSTRPDGKWACYEYAEWVARQQGKGVLGEARVVLGLLVYSEDITWSAHLYPTALQAFRRIRSIFRSLGVSTVKASEETIDIDGVVLKVWNSNTERGFERLDNGKRILFFARSSGGLRGFSPDVNVIDEAFAYTSEQQDAIAPTLIAKANAQTIYLSSPPLDGESGEVMYSLKKRAESGNAKRLGYRDWGLAGLLDDIDKIDIEDHALWALTCPGLNRGRVTLETIEALCPPQGSMTRKGFGREVLGLWPKQIIGGGAIDMGAWNGLMLDRESRREGDVAIAVDIAPERDYAAIGLYGLRRDGLGHVQIVDYRPGTDWLVDRIAVWLKELDPIAVAMGKATADSLEVDLGKRGIKRPDDKDAPKRGDLAVASWSEMSAATGQFLDAAKQATFRHAGQSELDSSVAGAKTKLNADSLVWARKDAASDTSPLVAITLARWAYESRAHLVRKRNYNLLDSVF